MVFDVEPSFRLRHVDGRLKVLLQIGPANGHLVRIDVHAVENLTDVFGDGHRDVRSETQTGVSGMLLERHF